MTTSKWDYLGGRSAAPLYPGITIEETNGRVTEIREGEFQFQRVTRRHSSRWASAAPLGSLAPRRAPISKEPETLTLRGAVYLPRLAAARAHATNLARLITRTVQVTLHIERGNAQWYTVDDFVMDWEYSGGLELGGEWSLTLTETSPPQSNTPT